MKIFCNFLKLSKYLLLFLLVYFLIDPVLRTAAWGAIEAIGSYAVPALNATRLAAGYNIIFIVTDQERYFAGAPQGADYKARARLKNIGVSFEKHYVCSAMSTSSRSVIYTGRHITDTKMFENSNAAYQTSMNADIATIGDMARSLGYYAAYKGKLHLITAEDSEKFDGSLEAYGFSDWEGEPMSSPLEGHELDPAIAEQATLWLKTKGKSLNDENKPFFLAVNLVNPHDIMYFNTDAPGVTEQNTGNLLLPINRAPDTPLYRTTYPSAPIAATWSQDLAAQIAAHGEYRKAWGANVGLVPSEAENWERFRDYYYNAIQESDNQLLKILDETEALGLMDRTIIIFTSDHGELQGAHGLNGKGNFVYENNAHVPLVIYHPAVEGNKKINALTSHLDIAPTIIDMTGAGSGEKTEAAKGLSGRSFLGLIDGTKTQVRAEALFACSLLSIIDSRYPYTEPTAAPLLASPNRGIIRGMITSDGYKFARYFTPLGHNTPHTLQELFEGNDVEIFDMNNDPEELENLAQKLRASDPELVMRLNARLNKIIAMEIGVDNGKEFTAAMPSTSSDEPSSGGCAAGGLNILLILPLFAIGVAKLVAKNK